MNDTREARIATVNRELEQLIVRQEGSRPAPRSTRRISGASVVFSVRLDPAELAAVESRALEIGVKPSALARNLIRTGLAAGRGDQLAAALDRLEAAVTELRTVAR